jgi:hypothetical protein
MSYQSNDAIDAVRANNGEWLIALIVALVILCLTALSVLFAGTPDLMDRIISAPVATCAKTGVAK